MHEPKHIVLSHTIPTIDASFYLDHLNDPAGIILREDDGFTAGHVEGADWETKSFSNGHRTFDDALAWLDDQVGQPIICTSDQTETILFDMAMSAEERPFYAEVIAAVDEAEAKRLDETESDELAELREEAREELTEIITQIDPARFYRTLHRRVSDDAGWKRFYRRAYQAHGRAGGLILTEEMHDRCDMAVTQHLDNMARRKAERAERRKAKV